MPRRSLSQQSFYDPEIVQPDCLESGTVPWLLARFRSKLFPAWLFAGWRGEGRRGRAAWPAVTLVTLLFLRWTEEGMSRLGSTKRAKSDVTWRAALGLHLQTQIPNEKTLREFEAFLLTRHPTCGTPRYLILHEHIVRVCLDEGVVGDAPVWTTDSTPMWCYGAVSDTIRLLGDGTRMLVQQWVKATGESVEDVAASWDVPWVLAKSIKGYFPIEWSSKTARAEVTETLASGALRAVEFVRRHLDQARFNRRRRLLHRCRNLVRVVEQNLETDEQGRLVIAKRVAKDRIVSLTDPCARHGRKSRSKTFNGFKLHVLGDIVSGLIASVTVTAGNHHDGSVAHRLIRRAKELYEEFELVLGDTAYGGASLRHRTKAELGVEIISPPPPITSKRPGALGRDDFEFDFDIMT
ncbi:transposase, partial [bacterium]|nr:transposase [bacterium]